MDGSLVLRNGSYFETFCVLFSPAILEPPVIRDFMQLRNVNRRIKNCKIYEVRSKINANASLAPLLKVLQKLKRAHLKGLNLTNKMKL